MGKRSPWELLLLGELVVRRDGRNVPLPASRKTRALLGYLVATGRPVARSRLGELLWEGPVDPLGELRWSLSRLRSALDEGPAAGRLVADRERVGFEPGGAFVDHAELPANAGAVAALDLDEIARLESLFRGELLAGLDLPDSFRYNAWLTAERERLFDLRSRLLARLSGEHADAGEALRFSRAWIAHDPLSEAAHAAAVRRLHELGRPREAAEQADACRRILRQELGVAPGALLAAAAAARRSTPAPPSRPAPRPEAVAPVATVPSGPETIGRERELALAEAALASAAGAARAPLALFLGEAGIGKTCLLEELSRRVRAAGGRVLEGRVYEAASERPYGPWIELFRRGIEPAGKARFRELLAPLLSEIVLEGASPLQPQRIDRERWHGELARMVGEIAGGGGTTLVRLDDLHWLDESSAALLEALRERLAGSPIVFAGAARPAEIAAGSPLSRMLGGAGATDVTLSVVEVGPLPLAACEALVRRETGTQVGGLAAGAASRLARESGGHPLYAIELARAALGTGESPRSLASGIGGRLARLGDAARGLAGWAAIVGTDFELELLAELAEIPRPALLEGVAELERHGLLRPTPGGERYDFAHDVVRRVAYEQIPAPRRRFQHAAVARALAASPRRANESATEIARHAAAGGDSPRAAEAFAAAGERALRLFARDEAADLAGCGLAQLARLDELETLALRFRLLRILVHAALGRPVDAELANEIHRRVELARGARRLAEVQVGLYLLAVLSEAAGNLDGAERQVLAAVESARGADDATAARALANTGRCLAQIERSHARAEALLLEARGLATRAGIGVIDVPWGLGLLAQAAGRHDEAEEELSAALAAARAAADPWVASQCAARLLALALERRDAENVRVHARELDEISVRLGEAGGERAFAAGARALVALSAGEAAASAALEAALADLRAMDSKGLLALLLIETAEAESASGLVDPAERRAREALAAATAVGRRRQAARARLLLARLAGAARSSDAAGHLGALLELDCPVGALARPLVAAAHELARQFSIPTPVPTPECEGPPEEIGEAP